MKGKAKKDKESTDPSEDTTCPLQLIQFKAIDKQKVCPRLTSVVERNEDEGIGSEDLDALQSELETLLVSVVQRQRLLETEMESLVNWSDSKNKDKRSPTKPTEVFGKRSKFSEEKPNKRFKDNQLNSNNSSGKSRSQKAKNLLTKNTESEYSEPQKAVSKAIVFKNDIPNQFWQFVEPYYCEITSDNIKFLSEEIKCYENESEFYKIPNLGKHYSLKWDDTNIIGQKDKKKGLSASNCSGSRSSLIQSTNKSKKGSKNHSEPDKTSFGALTQRLVSCLIEENLLNGGLIDSKSITNDSKPSNGNHKTFKSLNLGNTAQLERLIRKELEEHGIISLDDILNGSDASGGDEDEILQELKRCQKELKSLSDKNQKHLKRLLNASKKEMTKQEISKKLDLADMEVTEAYRRVVSAKQKKRPLTKKEKDVAFKAIKDREQVLKQLQSLSN
ncbi:transcriptional adapter 3-A-like [Oppia nitens]|uniref:transcriptional adapter 3-A-like n=1 Tax=Oppia nitens TaxID=1686743 RepID=UPI0023DA3555|nr:transcriptional adapter 3-A-like [Oppia nitens]